MALTTTGTKTIKDSAGADVIVKTVNDSADSSTSPSHGIIDGLGNQFDPSGKVFTGGTVTRPADTTAYTPGDLVANSTTAGSVLYPQIQITNVTDQPMKLSRMRLRKTGTSFTNGMFRIHLYRAQPSVANGDNGAWSTSGSANYVGAFDVTISRAFTDGSVGIGSPTEGSAIITPPVSGQNYLFYLIQAMGTYTPSLRVATAAHSAAGTGYAVNDLITLTGGTANQQAVLRVTGVSGGAITSVSIEYAGSYSAFPSSPASQGSTTGSGTGATFTVTSGGEVFTPIIEVE